MRKYRLVVRLRIYMGRLVTDYDLWCLNCLHVSPIFYANPDLEAVEIIDDAYECFFAGRSNFCHTESVELIPVA